MYVGKQNPIPHPHRPNLPPLIHPLSRSAWVPSLGWRPNANKEDILEYPSYLGRGMSISRKANPEINHIVTIIGWGPCSVSLQQHSSSTLRGGAPPGQQQHRGWDHHVSSLLHSSAVYRVYAPFPENNFGG